MRDLLPAASIAITTPVPQFFDEVASIVDSLSRLKLERDASTLSSFNQEILNFDYIGVSLHHGLYGQMIGGADDDRVILEVRAQSWESGEPTYSSYTEALLLIFKDLLKVYNQRFLSRYRLQIDSRDACEPRLSPKTRESFDTFVNSANKNGLHPLDWDRFYRFSYLCHVYRVHTNEGDMARLLVNAGFDDVYATEIASVYCHLRRYNQTQ